jgi:hypothetical protein
MGHILHGIEKGLAGKKFEPSPAEIISPPLHERSTERELKSVLNQGDILEKELFLQGFRPRGYNHPLSTQHCRDEIGQSLSCPRPGFHDEKAVL